MCFDEQVCVSLCECVCVCGTMRVRVRTQSVWTQYTAGRTVRAYHQSSPRVPRATQNA